MRRSMLLLCGAAFGLMALAPASAAWAQGDATAAVVEGGNAVDDFVYTRTPDSVLGATVSRPLVGGVQVARPTARAQELPVTGGDIAGLVLLGAAAIGTGTVMVRRSRSAD